MEHGGRLHFALSTSRRVSPLRERPSLKLGSAAGLSKLSPAISRKGTRRSFEHAAHSRSLIPLSVARSRADSTIRNSSHYFESASAYHFMTHIDTSSTCFTSTSRAKRQSSRFYRVQTFIYLNILHPTEERYQHPAGPRYDQVEHRVHNICRYLCAEISPRGLKLLLFLSCFVTNSLIVNASKRLRDKSTLLGSMTSENH
jgi:hypothetical protein